MKKQFEVDFAGKSYPALYIDNPKEGEAVINKLLESKELLIADCETAALPEYKNYPGAALSPHLAKPRLFQMFTGKAAVVLDLYKTGHLEKLGLLFEQRPSVFHNMNFDLKMLMKWHGVKYPDMHCTAIMARCCWQAMYAGFKSATLGDVAKALFKEDVIKKAGASDWSIPELTYEQVYYAAKDVVILSKIHEKLKDMMVKLQLMQCYEVYRKAQIVMSQIELNGISFDKEAHKHNIVKWRQEMADARDEVEQITGVQVITDQKISDWLFKKLDSYTLSLWPRTEKNEQRLAVNADAFVDFSHIDLVKPFSKFQKYKKLCTSFGLELFEKINPATGKIHASYFICGARTGRASCSNPNFQQSPRDKNFRKAFTASPGKVLVVADYSQIEVRYIAEKSQEDNILQAYEKGLDMYKYTASLLTGRPYETIGDEDPDRQAAKALVLGLNYGLGAKKFSRYAKKNYKVEISEENAHTEVQKYREIYPTLREWQLRQVDNCINNRFTCYEVLGKSNKLSEDSYFGAAMNHPIQGGCSSVMYLGLIYSERKLRNTSAKFLAVVHDEIVVECIPEEVEFVKKVLTEEMTLAYSRLVPNARTLTKLVTPHSGINWAEAKGK